MVKYVIKIIIVIILFIIIKDDIKKKVIYNRYSLILLGVGIYLGFLENDIVDRVLGACIYTAPFTLIYGYGSDLFGRECLGFGDIKLVFSLGSLLGFKNFYSVLLFMNITFLAASLYCILIYLKKREKMKEIALGPFLIIAFILQSLGWK